ncbi:hypothetical protein GCM10028857_11950 [Salinarchaeum chitinilyticum]
MSGSVVADFVAEALYDGAAGDEPLQARVLLSEDQLVLASDSGRTVVDLDDVFDVVVSKIPEDLGSFFDQSVLVAYADGADRRTALIRGEHDRIDRFALFLYKAILRGHPGEIRHPAREGGRVLDTGLESVAVVPKDDSLRFRGQETDLTISLDDVVGVEYRRDGEDGGRPLLAVTHRDGDAVVTTEIYHDASNRLNVLARILRSEFYRADEVLEDVELGEIEKRALVALYAGVPVESLPRVLAESDRAVGADRRASEADPEQSIDAEAILEKLAGEGLVADVDTGSLSHDGALVAIHRIDDVES